MEIKKLWSRQGNALYLSDVSATQNELENVIYVVKYDADRRCLFLEEINKSYEFDFKIYGMETDFINRVLKTYNSTTGNLGVLLNGIKGTGKTITAELIANKLNQPVILVSNNYKGLNEYISSIHQDVTILIDEYDKVYGSNIDTDDEDEQGSSKQDSSLLSLMDGTFKNKYRKMFLLTTNRLWINENMINRPGRIRYKKEFGDLNRDQIMEIIDDKLEDKKYTDEVIEFLKPLKIITVDIVKAIITEINIFDESPNICCKNLNIEMKEDSVSVVKINEEGEEDEVIIPEMDANTANTFKFYVNTGRTGIELQGTCFHNVEDKNREKDRHLMKDYTNPKSKPFRIKFDKVKPTHKSLIYQTI